VKLVGDRRAAFISAA